MGSRKVWSFGRMRNRTNGSGVNLTLSDPMLR